MAYAWEKYKLVLTGMDCALMGEARTKRLVEAWAKDSGVQQVSNGMICADLQMEYDWIVYTAEVDSAGWTGISS